MHRPFALKAAAAAAAVLLLAAGLAGATGQKEVKPVNFALSGNPDTLDPQKTAGTLTFQVDRSIFDTLVEPDIANNDRIVPALAESWETSADNLTWTFHLRGGVVFHNGDAFTSADVKATLERIKAKDTGSPKAGEYSAIQQILTPDDSTVVLKLSQAYAPLLATLASGWSAILPKSLIDQGHDFGAQPVGTGPYVMKEWVRDSRIVLEKNPNYWMSGAPKVQQVVMNIIPERAVQVQGLLSGQVDISYIVDQEDVPQLEGSGDLVVQKHLTSLIQVMAMNCSRPPLSDLKVRQAINYAIDQQQVLDVAYGGGMPIGTFMNYGNAYYVDFTNLYPYDPEKARSLLAQAGVGKDTVLELFLPQNYPPHVKAGEMYQEMLTKVGLNVQIKLVDWSTWLSEVYSNAQYDLTVIGHTGKLDPNGTLAGYGTDKRYVRWVNPKVADLIEKAAVTTGFQNRKKLYDQALEIMARDVPFMYLGTSYRRVALRNTISGFRMDPILDTFDFRHMEVK